MKRFLLAGAMCLAFTANVSAQATPAAAQASKADVEKYLQAVHSREMMQSMLGAMSQPMQQMIHEQYMKDKEHLPADFEARMNKMITDLWKQMPFDEMIQSMVPTYQKHFTKGDMDAMVVFYSSPAGQKVLRELPAVTQETMQAMSPIMRQYMEVVNKRVQQEVTDIKAAQAKAGAGAAAPRKGTAPR